MRLVYSTIAVMAVWYDSASSSRLSVPTKCTHLASVINMPCGTVLCQAGRLSYGLRVVVVGHGRAIGLRRRSRLVAVRSHISRSSVSATPMPKRLSAFLNISASLLIPITIQH